MKNIVIRRVNDYFKVFLLFILDIIWRPEGEFDEDARKIIIFLTDQSSHYALDGLLGGIVTPAGMSCNIFLYNILRNISLDIYIP